MDRVLLISFFQHPIGREHRTDPHTKEPYTPRTAVECEDITVKQEEEKTGDSFKLIRDPGRRRDA